MAGTLAHTLMLVQNKTDASAELAPKNEQTELEEANVKACLAYAKLLQRQV
jgi:hypothetical protein